MNVECSTHTCNYYFDAGNELFSLGLISVKHVDVPRIKLKPWTKIHTFLNISFTFSTKLYHCTVFVFHYINHVFNYAISTQPLKHIDYLLRSKAQTRGFEMIFCYQLCA